MKIKVTGVATWNTYLLDFNLIKGIRLNLKDEDYNGQEYTEIVLKTSTVIPFKPDIDGIECFTDKVDVIHVLETEEELNAKIH